MNIAEQKATLRRQLRAALKNLSPAERAAASQNAVNLFQSQSVWLSARVVLLFAPLPDEPDLWPLAFQTIQMGKQLVLLRHEADGVSYMPRVVHDLERDLVAGPHGIREPRPECPLFPLNRLDLVLAPGVGFDLRGHRLGRGRGVFDRLLPATTGTRVGVAFDCQIVDAIPAEAHDAGMDYLLTPTRWRAAAARG